MEMKYFWLIDKEADDEFKFHYLPGQENLGDHHTKVFNAKDTNRVRPFYVHEKQSPHTLVRLLISSLWRGCLGNISSPCIRRKPLTMLPRVINQVPAVEAA